MVLTRRKEREEKRKGHGFQRAGRFSNGGQQAPGWWKARGKLRERPERQWRDALAFGYYLKEKEIGK